MPEPIPPSLQGRVFLCGVPGVGKSSVLQAIREQGVPGTVTFGDLMFQAARSDGFQGSRDEMRTLPNRELDAYRERACDNIPDPCILDGHLTVERDGSYEPAVPAQLSMPRALLGILILEADASSILDRRAGRGRDSGLRNLQAIQTHQAANEKVARGLVEATGAWLHVLKAEGPAEQVAQQVLEILRERAIQNPSD